MAKQIGDRKLTQRQELAVRELGKGKGLTAAARAVGVSRQTLYRWLSDPGFVAAMNRWRESVVTLAQGQVLAGLGAAAATVVKAAREGNARIAMTLLEKTGVFDPLARHLTDPQTVAREQILYERAQRAALDSAEEDLRDAELHNTLRRGPSELRPPKPAPAPNAKADKGSSGTAAQSPPQAPASTKPDDQPHDAPKPPESPSSPAPATYVPDPELEAAIAAADALKAAEAKILEQRRKAEEQQSPPPLSHSVSLDLSHGSTVFDPEAQTRREFAEVPSNPSHHISRKAAKAQRQSKSEISNVKSEIRISFAASRLCVRLFPSGIFTAAPLQSDHAAA
jgi:hypothetical protein